MEDEVTAEVMKVFWDSKIDPSVPPRYRRLLREVAERLPKGWDDHAEWEVESNPDQHPQGYACVLQYEEGARETVMNYTVTIFPGLLDRLSDSACRWVFAHEFAHIASKVRTGSIAIGGRPYTRVSGAEYVEAPSKKVHEDAADRIAMDWGFDRELLTFLDEGAAQ